MGDGRVKSIEGNQKVLVKVHT